MKNFNFILVILITCLAALIPQRVFAVIDYGCWGTINVYMNSTITVTAQYDIFNYPELQSKIKSITWTTDNDQNSSSGLGYEIVSQNGKTCVIKGATYTWDNDKLYCKMTYGQTDYIAYYNIKTISKGHLTLQANPTSGTVSPGTKVKLTCNQPDATIFYTIDGTNPVYDSSSYLPVKGYLYTSTGITIDKALTIKAFAAKAGYTHEIQTFNYQVSKVPVRSITLNKKKHVIANN